MFSLNLHAFSPPHLQIGKISVPGVPEHVMGETGQVILCMYKAATLPSTHIQRLTGPKGEALLTLGLAGKSLHHSFSWHQPGA